MDQIIATVPSSSANYGMCVKIMDPANTDTQTADLGGYCVSYLSADGDSAVDSRTVSTLTSAQFTAATYSPTTGTELTYAANGLINSPDDSSVTTGGYNAGATVTAKWYQPI